MKNLTLTLITLLLYIVSGNGNDGWAESPATDVTFFENRIRPVLVKHCYECHSADSKELGGKLRLDTKEGIQKGGESGPALVAGKPEMSLMIEAMRYNGLDMPPDKPLPETVIQDFVKWIERGAIDPRSMEAVTQKENAGEKNILWSLIPPNKPKTPTVQDKNWPRDPLDQFVLARLEMDGLRPTHDANPRTLIRRIYFDLIGLPPSFDQVESFLIAHQQDPIQAVEHLVDQLMAQPQFGERWGRHWLDVARYGESNGNDGLSRNPTFPHAWRYRDYVIDSFNQDTPYNRFLTEQIAGDLLPSDSPEEQDRHLIATGFLALASKPAKAMNTNFEMDVVADQIDVIGRGLMGFSVACARCHDHKFDPIPTSDYYALAGIFTSTETMWGVSAHEKLTAPSTDLHVLKVAAKVPPPEDFVETVLVLESNTGKPKPVPKSKWAPGTPLAMGVRDMKKPADCKINIKGESKKLGPIVPRGFLSACDEHSSHSIEMDPLQSGRLELAEWITRENHPLTSRVMVNRIWLHLYGDGIVRTPDDFGVYGDRPTNPELLDHLAIRFTENNWSVKKLIRSIVLSRTYQLSSAADESLLEADGENRLLARHNFRRLDVESLRDSMLQASGQLILQPGEGSIIRHRDILVNLAGNLHQSSNHRSVYLCYLRGSPPPELATFDLPDFTSVVGQRDVSTIPGQALHLFNSPFVIQQATEFARSLINHSPEKQARVYQAYRRTLARDPSPQEIARALELLRLTNIELNSEEKSWASLCQSLMATNEFRYVD
ncbi:MAG: PSD1 and planctomycete cytochrome C domain-containing protein [Planctomycetaceae bacterium]|nr:PSD1 and planctomycete cytochrome C domain-containing protein [Planctomycetaceae bacterium]